MLIEKKVIEVIELLGDVANIPTLLIFCVRICEYLSCFLALFRESVPSGVWFCNPSKRWSAELVVSIRRLMAPV